MVSFRKISEWWGEKQLKETLESGRGPYGDINLQSPMFNYYVKHRDHMKSPRAHRQENGRINKDQEEMRGPRLWHSVLAG